LLIRIESTIGEEIIVIAIGEHEEMMSDNYTSFIG
jgi:hypothetical protein